MASKNGILTVHAQQYIRDIFADRLVQEGFASLNKDDVAWYRIVNNELIQTVYFYTRFTWIPMELSLGVGCHPTYIEPLFPTGVYYYSLPESREILREIMLTKMHGVYYSKTVPVFCPADDFKGLDVLEDSGLAALNSIKSEQMCYDAHKSYYLNDMLHNISMEFIDEVIYHHDSEMYEPCRKRIDFLIRRWKSYPQTQKMIKRLAYLELQKNALETGDLSVILEGLEARKRKIAKTLMKKVGI